MQLPPIKGVRSRHVTFVNHIALLSELVSFLKILLKRKTTQVLWQSIRHLLWRQNYLEFLPFVRLIFIRPQETQGFELE